MPQEIKVLVNEDGTIQIEAVGFKGNACEKATAALEKALGQTTSKKRKPEFHAGNKTGQQIGH